MPEESGLRKMAREAMRAGTLPIRRPDRTWGGPGIGVPCRVCREAITKNQLEFELQFSHAGAVPGLDRYHVHIRCFAAWEFERNEGGAHS
ncbi:MAG: hypothetical protein ACREK4_11535 [Candidatus Rokuibacteriota bacterium]